MTFKLSELLKLPEKKEQKILTSSGYMDSDLSIGYNYALSELANMEITVDEGAVARILKDTKDCWDGLPDCDKVSSPVAGIKLYAHAIASQLPKILKVSNE